MTTRQLRLLRGAAASSVATLLAALSHTFGGAWMPHPLLVLSVSVLLTPLAALLVGSRIRLSGLAAAVTATQLAFHTVFEMAGSAASSASGPVAGHQHGPIVLTFSPAPEGAAAAASAGMLTAHLIAAAVTTLLLWHGERMILAIARWVRAQLRADQPVAASSPADVRVPVLRTERRATTRRLAGGVRRRGPPAPARG